jgi:hypothetical protein
MESTLFAIQQKPSPASASATTATTASTFPIPLTAQISREGTAEGEGRGSGQGGGDWQRGASATVATKKGGTVKPVKYRPKNNHNDEESDNKDNDRDDNGTKCLEFAGVLISEFELHLQKPTSAVSMLLCG